MQPIIYRMGKPGYPLWWQEEKWASLESLVAAMFLYRHNILSSFLYLFHLFSTAYFLLPLPFFPGNALEMKVILAGRMEEWSCLGVFPNPPELWLRKNLKFIWPKKKKIYDNFGLKGKRESSVRSMITSLISKWLSCRCLHLVPSPPSTTVISVSQIQAACLVYMASVPPLCSHEALWWHVLMDCYQIYAYFLL